MKKIIYIWLMIIGVYTQSIASDIAYLGHGGPFIKISQIDGHTISQYGIYGVQLYENKIIGGLAAVGATFSYGGIYLGYRLNTLNHINIIPNITMGYGYYSKENREFSLLDPGVNIEFSLSEYKKIFIGINYRITNHTNNMNGLAFIAGIKYGHF